MSLSLTPSLNASVSRSRFGESRPLLVRVLSLATPAGVLSMRTVAWRLVPMRATNAGMLVAPPAGRMRQRSSRWVRPVSLRKSLIRVR